MDGMFHAWSPAYQNSFAAVADAAKLDFVMDTASMRYDDKPKRRANIITSWTGRKTAEKHQQYMAKEWMQLFLGCSKEY